MSTLKLKGSTSGYVELTAPATAGNNTITLPTTAGTVAVVDNSGKLGVGTANPATELQVVGVVSATSYQGDGSQLTGVGGGFNELDAALFN